MKTYFRMSAAADTGNVMLYDEIGDNTATDFNAELNALGPVKNINLRINSPGGNVFDGLAIYNMLKNHPATVTASIDGIAASAASLIAMAADKIVMPENSFMLIHAPSGMTIGTSADHSAMAADLLAMEDQFAKTYAARSRNSIASVKALMGQDRLMTADEAKQAGYADEVIGSARMVASFDLGKLPQNVQAAINSASASDHFVEWKRLQNLVKTEMKISKFPRWALSVPSRGLAPDGALPSPRNENA